jgi:antitoxin component YwqK of YwqJK toxin-antitoxin module
MNHYPNLYLLISIIMLLGCQSKTEIIESVDTDGMKMRIERNRSDQKRNGIYEKFYPNGKVAESAQFLNDSVHGEHRMYFENGQVHIIEHFDNGKLHGPFLRYREDGSKYIEQNFVHGHYEGWSTRYYPNGQVEERVMLVHSEENGPFTEYYPNGKLKAEGTYVYYEEEAVEHGELREYDSTGTLVRIADCQYGNCRTRK